MSIRQTVQVFAIASVLAPSFGSLAGCGDDAGVVTDSGGADGGDGAVDAAADVGLDAGDDGGSDAGTSGCTRVSALAWELELTDDVSVSYRATLDPIVSGMGLRLLFERYSPGPDIGVFPLGEGADGNFGTCAHCVHIPIDPERVYFADRGSLETRVDPYSRSLDVSLTGVRLIEATVDPLTRTSTPVPDGACVEVDDATAAGTFPAPGWTCDPSSYGDGVACNCACGAYDPDCAVGGECPPFDPMCEPTETLPLADCERGDVCGFDPLAMAPACVETCDWVARSGCDSGICSFTFGVTEEDACITLVEQLDAASFGEECDASGLQKVCNVVGGFAEGFCDPANVCKRACTSDAECTAPGETCRRFLFDGVVGYCGGVPVDGDG